MRQPDINRVLNAKDRLCGAMRSLMSIKWEDVNEFEEDFRKKAIEDIDLALSHCDDMLNIQK